ATRHLFIRVSFVIGHWSLVIRHSWRGLPNLAPALVHVAFPCEFHPHRSARAWIESPTATHAHGVATRKATVAAQRNSSWTRRHRAGGEVPGSPQRDRRT